MQLIGFNLKKIKAEKSPNYKRSSINTNIEFTDVIKEKVDLLKEATAIKISFIFSVVYSDAEDKETVLGEISFEGEIVFSADKEETKDITKAWKKKTIPENLKIPLFNFILKRCSTKALTLEEHLNLPSHIPFPPV
jgi:hypothetical protein